MNEQPKICRDCWYFPKFKTPAECWHPDNLTIDLVFGEHVGKRTPKDLRSDASACGREGKWFASEPMSAWTLAAAADEPGGKP